MGFATAWLDEWAVFESFLNEPPAENTGLVVVIPACNEPGITNVLDSLLACDIPQCGTEVLIVVNAAPGSAEEVRENNRITLRNIESWKNEHSDSFFRLFVLEPDTAGFTKWGVGLARRCGMDEALRRFNHVDRPDGIILSLDADCTVNTGYLTAVEKGFSLRPGAGGCSVYFEHQVNGNEISKDAAYHIILYELHLRYFLHGLIYAGYPNAFHTVGSAMASRAGNYMRVGGMNRRQAGEDFYFIQKLIDSGGFFNITDTAVYPSARISSRVPFGTGATMARMAAGNDSEFLSYNIESFDELAVMSAVVKKLAAEAPGTKLYLYNELPLGIRNFIDDNEWEARISEIRFNTSSAEAFVKRFYRWFNMFRVVKYMNYVHVLRYEKRSVTESAAILINKEGITVNSVDIYGLLTAYRSLDRQRG